jgi:predicted esterase
MLNFTVATHHRVSCTALVVVFLFALCSRCTDGQELSPTLDGDYLGQLGQHHLLLHIRNGMSGRLTGTLDSLDQQANGIRCGNLISSGVQLSFQVPEVQAAFKGQFSSDGNTITGTWTQGGSSPLIFTRRTSIRTPAKDSTKAYEFRFSDESRMYYSFIPDSSGPLPVVLLLHGSGRSGQVMVDAWKSLASKEHFIVVAPDSYDPSGWSVKIDSPAFFHAVIEQVAAKHAIDVNRIYLFGHSGGAVHALVLALIDSDYYAATAAHAGALPPGYENALFSRVVRRMPIEIWVGDKDPLFPLDAVTNTKRLFEKNGFHVELSVIPNHDHNYYVVSGQVDTEVWGFFEKAGPKTSSPSIAPIDNASNLPQTQVPGETSSYFELPIQRLKGAVPALKGIKYDPSQEQLSSILDHVATTIADLLPRLPDLISREDVYHFQGLSDQRDRALVSQGVFEGPPTGPVPGGSSASQPWSQQFRFLLQCQRKADGSTTISESRISHGKLATDTSIRSYGFAYQWLLFSAANQPEFRFRYLGQQEKNGYKTFAIAFMQDARGAAEPAYFESQGKREAVYYQGVLWVDQSTFNIVSLRTDILAPLPDLRQMTTELTFRLTHIHGADLVFWLPSTLAISIDQGGGTVEESHRYSDYHLFHAQARMVPAP